jgi:hypothetical protein
MDTKVSLSEAYETLVQGYRKLKSIELIRELRHLTKHEGEVQNKADIVMRKSVVTELLHERLNPVFFVDTLRSLGIRQTTKMKSHE